MLSHSREPALQGALVLAKSGILGLAEISYEHYRSILNHCDIISLKIYRFWRKKRKIRAITSFKVIEVGTNRKPVCDFLLVINSN